MATNQIENQTIVTNSIDVKIDFLHNARPYQAADEYSNITVSYPLGALPNVGDIIQMDGITHPHGAFFVSSRVFESRQGAFYACTLTLGVEGN